MPVVDQFFKDYITGIYGTPFGAAPGPLHSLML